MADRRPLPWTDLLEAIGEARFTQLRDALQAAGVDALDRDRFVLNAAAGQLLKELMPEDAPAAAVAAWAALLHMLFLAWSAGWPVVMIGEAKLRNALDAQDARDAPALPPIAYLQLPARLVWAEPEPGQPHEPLDGLFVAASKDRLRVLAILGLHALREGFTTIEAESALPASPPGPRAGGSAAFASVLPGGDRARLFSVVSPEELVWLAARLPLDVSS